MMASQGEEVEQQQQHDNDVFDAVSKQDFEGMMEHYLRHARYTLHSFLALKKRWSRTSTNAAPMIPETTRSEEKLDEFFQHIASETARWAQQRSALMLNGFHDQSVYYAALAEIDELLASIHQKHQQRQAVAEEAEMEGIEIEYSDAHSAPPHPSTCYDNNNNRLLMPPVISSRMSSAGRTKNRSSTNANPFASEERYRDAGDRLVWQSVNVLSNSRPPTNFVVYHENEDEEAEEVVDEMVDGDDDDDDNNNNNIVEPQPPLFDGQVANATPPPLGPTGIRPSGGSGTLLHLSCAVDSPFCLAVTLAMGADARSPHTAFRRLMIHEAACCGSSKCLELLLELGEDCAYEMYTRDQLLHKRRSNTSASFFHQRTAAAGTTGGADTPKPRDVINLKLSTAADPGMDMPFFPFEESSSTSPPLPFERPSYARQVSLSPPRVASPTAMSSPLSSSSVQSDQSFSKEFRSWVQILRTFLQLARDVRQGRLDELDAARIVLSYNTISEATKSIIAQSCSFLVKDCTMAGNPYQCAWFADGHGNTPLHWAAFKNEETCVALLLKYHADPNARARPSGWTPLHDAAYSNSSESLVHLLNAGADVDIRANSGATPLCFAAQEDSAEAANILLERGADMSKRCSMGPNHQQRQQQLDANDNNDENTRQNNNNNNFAQQQGNNGGRFSGYSPLHYCAHYSAHRAARVLLAHPSAKLAMEIPDVTDRLPIHVAVARGSSDVLRELLHAGARVDTPRRTASAAVRTRALSPTSLLPPPNNIAPPVPQAPQQPRTPTRSPDENSGDDDSSTLTPVSSPVLRSMIPSRPITSSKPWNCLTQQAIDECRDLISQTELHWTPERHHLFTPEDRIAVMEVLRVGKRLEQQGSGIFLDLWPEVLSFCGRGWFVACDQKQLEQQQPIKKQQARKRALEVEEQQEDNDNDQDDEHEEDAASSSFVTAAEDGFRPRRRPVLAASIVSDTDEVMEEATASIPVSN